MVSSFPEKNLITEVGKAKALYIKVVTHQPYILIANVWDLLRVRDGWLLCYVATMIGVYAIAPIKSNAIVFIVTVTTLLALVLIFKKVRDQ
jgi:hypothetical protein